MKTNTFKLQQIYPQLKSINSHRHRILHLLHMHVSEAVLKTNHFHQKSNCLRIEIALGPETIIQSTNALAMEECHSTPSEEKKTHDDNIYDDLVALGNVAEFVIATWVYI